MKLTQRADYGLVAVLYLAQKSGDRRCSVDEISRAMDIPEAFLRKIFQTLAKSGTINSFKGRGGGVSLARPPKDITVAEIIKPLGEEMGMVRCLRGKGHCPRLGECMASNLWRKIQQDFFEILDRTSIKDLIEGGKQDAAEG
jgi:Rrf2 family nitric oxide-sensitive transcriptional repressor